MICMATIALAVIGVPYVTTLGLTSAIYVAFTIVAALTLQQLPAQRVFAAAVAND